MAAIFRLSLLSACSLCLLVASAADTPAQEQQPEAPPTLEALAALAEELDANVFAERERASARLREIALLHRPTARESLVSIYKSAVSPEVRYRIYSILLDLAQGMRPASKPGFLGIMMMDSMVALPDGTNATSIIVRQVVAGTAAARAGLQLSDHIVAVDGEKLQPAATAADTASARFSEYIRGKAAQAEVELEVYSSRKRAVNKIRITLGERPDQYEDVRYKRNLANDVVRDWVGGNSE